MTYGFLRKFVGQRVCSGIAVDALQCSRANLPQWRQKWIARCSLILVRRMRTRWAGDLYGLFALCFCALLLTACAALTEKQALALATEQAIRSGYDLRRYKAPRIHYNFTKADDTWVVFYDPIPDKQGRVAIGDDFTVYVDNQTRKTELIPGR